MLLSAGRGLRFRPVTARIPKPLIPFLNVPLIDGHLRRPRRRRRWRKSASISITSAIRSSATCAIAPADLPKLRFFPEPVILGTAGALANAAGFLVGRRLPGRELRRGDLPGLCLPLATPPRIGARGDAPRRGESGSRPVHAASGRRGSHHGIRRRDQTAADVTPASRSSRPACSPASRPASAPSSRTSGVRSSNGRAGRNRLAPP